MKAWNNLNKEEQAARSKKCAVGCAVIAMIFIILAVAVALHTRSVKKKCTETTTGAVISVYTVSKFRWQAYLTAEYVVNGVAYDTNGRYSSGYTSSDTFSRKPVTVHYDPSDPGTSYAADAPTSMSLILYIIMAVVFAIAVPLFIWQAGKIKKKDEIKTTELYKSAVKNCRDKPNYSYRF